MGGYFSIRLDQGSGRLTKFVNYLSLHSQGSVEMKLTLHHVSFSSENVSQMDAFYNDVLMLPPVTEDIPKQEKNKGYAGQLAFKPTSRKRT
mgnify:CR=1 FL=1